MKFKSLIIKGLLISSILGVGASFNGYQPFTHTSSIVIHAKASVPSHAFINRCKHQQLHLNYVVKYQTKLLHHIHNYNKRQMIKNQLRSMKKRLHILRRFIKTYNRWQATERVYQRDYRQYMHNRAIFQQRHHQVQRMATVAKHHSKPQKQIRVVKQVHDTHIVHHESLNTVLNHIEHDDNALNNRSAENWLNQYRHNSNIALNDQTEHYVNYLNDLKINEHLLVHLVGNFVKPNLERLNHLL